MTGNVKGLVARTKKENPDVEWIHYIIHRELLASKEKSSYLHETLIDPVKVINFIKSKPLNKSLFHRLRESHGVRAHRMCSGRWVLHERVLARLFELRDEVASFLSWFSFCHIL